MCPIEFWKKFKNDLLPILFTSLTKKYWRAYLHFEICIHHRYIHNWRCTGESTGGRAQRRQRQHLAQAWVRGEEGTGDEGQPGVDDRLRCDSTRVDEHQRKALCHTEVLELWRARRAWPRPAPTPVWSGNANGKEAQGWLLEFNRATGPMLGAAASRGVAMCWQRRSPCHSVLFHRQLERLRLCTAMPRNNARQRSPVDEMLGAWLPEKGWHMANSRNGRRRWRGLWLPVRWHWAAARIIEVVVWMAADQCSLGLYIAWTRWWDRSHQAQPMGRRQRPTITRPGGPHATAIKRFK
jgi:hypothetical protein